MSGDLILVLWRESESLHLQIQRAIDVKYHWMVMAILTAILLVPLMVTVPGLAWASWNLLRLKRQSDRILERLTAMNEEA